MRLAAVETTDDFVLQSVSFRWICRGDHLLGQATELLRAEPAALNDLPGQIHDSDLFRSR